MREKAADSPRSIAEYTGKEVHTSCGKRKVLYHRSGLEAGGDEQSY